METIRVPRALEQRSSKILAWGIVAIALAMNAVILPFAFLHRADPYDYSSFMDTAWRIANGQRMYVDFLYSDGPVYPYLLAFFILIFGFTKYAVFAHLIAVSSIAALTVFAIFYRILPPLLAALTAVMTAAGFYWSYPIPVYTQDAYAIGLLGIWILTAQVPFSSSTRALWSGTACRFIIAITYMTKSTIGLPYGAVYLALMGLSPFRWRAFLGFAARALFALALLSMSMNFIQYYENIRAWYGLAFHRFLRFLNLSLYLRNLNFPVFLIAILFFPFQKLFWTQKKWVVLFFGTYGTVMFSYITGSQEALAHAPLLGALTGFAFVLFLAAKQTLPGHGRKRFQLAMRALVFVGILQIYYCAHFAIGYSIGKYRGSGKQLFDISEPHAYVIKTPSFAGWHTQPVWGEALDHFTNYIRENIPEDESILTLPPWGIINGLTGRQNYKKYPYQTGMDANPKNQEPASRSGALLWQNPPDWILTHRHPRAPLPILNKTTQHLNLDAFILKYYEIHEIHGIAGLFKRKQEPVQT